MCFTYLKKKFNFIFDYIFRIFLNNLKNVNFLSVIFFKKKHHLIRDGKTVDRRLER